MTTKYPGRKARHTVDPSLYSGWLFCIICHSEVDASAWKIYVCITSKFFLKFLIFLSENLIKFTKKIELFFDFFQNLLLF